MALKMTKLFGSEPRMAENADFDVPTTQVRMGITSPVGFDPLTTMGVGEPLNRASNNGHPPSRLPLIGKSPVVRQFQILGVLTAAFVAIAVFMVYLDNRAAAQRALHSSAATEMQMLSQRLARGSALAAQGQSAAFDAVRDSRDRFKANVDALTGSLGGALLAGIVLLVIAAGATFAGELTGGGTLALGDLLLLALLPFGLTVLATWVARTTVLAALRQSV